jgi:hypothetical protein
VSHQLRYVIGIESGLAQSSAIGGPEIVPDQAFNLCISTSPGKCFADLSIWAARNRINPHIVIRSLAFTEFKKDLPDFRVNVDKPSLPALGLVKDA